MKMQIKKNINLCFDRQILEKYFSLKVLRLILINLLIYIKLDNEELKLLVAYKRSKTT